jgi:hypothetical protein
VQSVVKGALQVLRKRLHLKAYNVSIVEYLTDVYMVVLMEFWKQMFHAMSIDQRDQPSQDMVGNLCQDIDHLSFSAGEERWWT